jgi:hypothetical protein
MSIVHSQLAIFGAIDELVLAARTGTNKSTDRAVLKAAGKLLPNTTGFREAGWHRELQELTNREGVRSPNQSERFTFPALEAAAAELMQVRPPRSEPELNQDTNPTTSSAAEFTKTPPPTPEPDLNQVRNPDSRGGFEAQTFYDSARDPVLARAGYGAFALLKLGKMAGWDKLDETLRANLKTVLDVAVQSFSDGSQAATATDEITDAVDTIDTRQEWTEFVHDRVGPRFAAASKPCFGTLQQINGMYCSTVVTDCSEPTLSVADIEKIIDPMNWSLCSKFFCKMVQNTPNRNAEGWSRVQEQIGAECGEYRLVTDLIFYKVRQPDGSIFMNYDIDPLRSHPDRGYVKVDNGYIFVSPQNKANNPKQKGVRIRTSKREHVDGLSPCATAALACLMGWADAGREMLAGTAQRIINAKQEGRPTPKLKAFVPSDETDDAEKN